jgi:hypothetical protein
LMESLEKDVFVYNSATKGYIILGDILAHGVVYQICYEPDTIREDMMVRS